MKLPIVTFVWTALLIVCIVDAVTVPQFPNQKATRNTSKGRTLEDANKALSPSLKTKVTELVTGKPQPAKNVALINKNSNLLAVRNEDNKTFTVDGNKKLGSGAYGAVYDAKKHSNPNQPTVMKISNTDGSYKPDSVTKAKGESRADFRNRRNSAKQGAATNDYEQAKATVDKQNGFNKRMGLSAGKPVVVANGSKTMTALPMKKVAGAPLVDELLKGRGHPTYISSHTLVNNAKNAINETHDKGILHNDAHPGNVMVTKTGGKMIDYGYMS